MSDNKTDEEFSVDDLKAIEELNTKDKSQLEKEQQAAVSELSRVGREDKLSMHVKVYSPFSNYYDGPAFSLSAENPTGPFDVLPKHHNFMSLLSPCDVVIRTVKDGEQRIKISGGLMHVKADEIVVFLDV